MSTFVLIHGAAHGGWCWDKVVPLLEGLGHTAIAPDLPGHGQDATPAAEVTLESYVDCVCRLLDEQPEPVVLVGHSMGGISISQAAEYRPGKIRTLVYLTALLLENGDAFIPVPSIETETAEPEPEAVRTALEERPFWTVSSDLAACTYKDEQVQDLFYNDCSPQDIAWAKSQVVPQPVGPLLGRLAITGQNFGRVPRVYIECLEDQALRPEHQKRLYTRLPCSQVLSLNTGHSPFLSAPEELVRLLVSI